MSELSTGAKIAVWVMRGIRKAGLIKVPDADPDAAILKARAYNRKRPYKAILLLHGGGDRDTWKPEVSFARTYRKRAEMGVYYPIYPPFTEDSPARTAEFIFNVYREMEKEYRADKVAVVGGSYGGFLAMQLLTWINWNHADVGTEQAEMPGLLIMNSPFGYPKAEEEWKMAEELERNDAMIPPGAPPAY